MFSMKKALDQLTKASSVCWYRRMLMRKYYCLEKGIEDNVERESGAL